MKTLPRNLEIDGPAGGALRGKRLGSEFVAAHIWREVNGDVLASRSPLLNTFIPNLVWLPKQVAKLSDLEGRDVQVALKAASWAIYRDAPVAAHLTDVVEEAWQQLPQPPSLGEPLVLEQLNWFVSNPRFKNTRSKRLREVVAALERLEQGTALPKRVVCTRYAEGLPFVEAASRSSLRVWLERFDPA